MNLGSISSTKTILHIVWFWTAKLSSAQHRKSNNSYRWKTLGKKQKSWRSNLHQKLHGLMMMIVEKIPWNISVWNFIFIRQEINNTILRLEFIAQWAFYSSLFGRWCKAKFVIVCFFHYSLVTQIADRSRTFASLCIWFASLCIYAGLHEVRTHCQQLFCKQNQSEIQ